VAWQVFTKGATTAVGDVGRGFAGAAKTGVGAVGRRVAGGTRRGSEAAAQAGAQGVGRSVRAGRRGVGRTGQALRGAQQGARPAARAGARGAGAAPRAPGRAKGGLSKFDPANGGGRGRDKGKGWGRQALDRARGRGGPGPIGRSGRGGRGRGGEEEAAAGAGDRAAEGARHFLRNRFRRRHGPFRKTRRRVSIVVALTAVLMVPLAMGAYGAEADTEEREALVLMQAACGGGELAAPGADGGSDAGGGTQDGRLSVLEVAAAAAAGLRAEGVRNPTADQIATATAIAWAESDLNPRAHNATPPDDSYGLWQINMLGGLGPARRTKFGLQSNEELYSPAVNAKAMASISLGGTNWQPWTTYTSGAYRQYLSRVTAEAAQVAAASPGASDPNAPASPGAGCSGVGGPVADCGSAAVVRGDTTAVTFPQVTAATQTMAASAIQCFGRPYSVGCHSERPGDRFEHPRGRACDFMATAGGIAGGDERAWGQAMAEWVAAHAEELKVLYVIWADRSWNPADGDPVPWEQWRDYTGCANPCTDPTVGHFNHVHVSVHLQPGDPEWARCTHLTCSE
jgi:hypothetical protein